jgi:ParB family chromosome partitioning protein
VVEQVREVLGAIDLDPASCDAAQAVVRAGRHYTVADDGLAQPWSGRVFLNPPYSMPTIERFVDKAIGHHRAGDVPAAIVLTDSATETGWAQALLAASAATCFLEGRVRFWQPGRKAPSSPPRGQMFAYLGPDPARFRKVFGPLGVLMVAA